MFCYIIVVCLHGARDSVHRTPHMHIPSVRPSLSFSFRRWSTNFISKSEMNKTKRKSKPFAQHRCKSIYAPANWNHALWPTTARIFIDEKIKLMMARTTMTIYLFSFFVHNFCSTPWLLIQFKINMCTAAVNTECEQIYRIYSSWVAARMANILYIHIYVSLLFTWLCFYRTLVYSVSELVSFICVSWFHMIFVILPKVQ